ncbi:MAG: lytic transglycosylase domain-containing protein [Desulfobacteraceae bacterium]|nr:lytic transglycosylase domain-containing protein [Desulfobacteraceae bacterium]
MTKLYQQWVIYKIITVFAIACIFIRPAPARAEQDLYVYVDEQGVHHYTDTPMSAGYIKIPSPSQLNYNKKAEKRYEDIILELSRKSGVRPELIKAVIRVESGFNQKAISAKGARGLMQVMPVHAGPYKIKDPFDPRENITAGAMYLGKLIKRYNGNLNLALAAYNAGPATVDHYDGVPPYKETRKYVQKVLLHYRNYRKTGK